MKDMKKWWKKWWKKLGEDKELKEFGYTDLNGLYVST